VVKIFESTTTEDAEEQSFNAKLSQPVREFALIRYPSIKLQIAARTLKPQADPADSELTSIYENP
jgi:hypothetical protein